MVYNVPPSKASLKKNRFEFTLPGVLEEGKLRELSVPLLGFIKPELIIGLEGRSKIEAMRDIVESYYPGSTKGLEGGDQLLGLYNAWAEESGIELGESGA